MWQAKSLPVPARLLAVLAAFSASGCSSDTRSSIELPKVDPTAASNSALALYDTDANGSLSDAELAACPGILVARERYDLDRDGQISRDELSAHFAALFGGTAGLTNLSCRVSAAGRPLADAKVRFLPEPFLQDAIRPAAGTTDSQGMAVVAIDEGLPADQLQLRALQPGIYRVQIEHPGISAPHRPLGIEIDPGARGVVEPVFNL